VRWVNATKNPDTRGRRVEVSISKMNNGKRRPCCFNLSSCTDPDLSKNGKLLGPSAQVAVTGRKVRQHEDGRLGGAARHGAQGQPDRGAGQGD
jgi:hypothetical protein